ncbi:6335_t:CDS:1, partial [Paraglomus brasilianum]
DLLKSADIATRLIHHGIITHVAGECMQFAAPIMRIMLGQRLFYAPASLCLKLPAARNFEDFLLRSIERMQPSVLQESLSRRDADAPLLEWAWQVEWYRAATTCIKCTTISPDVSPRFGALGYLDFYVNSKFMWGVELLREGSRMREHAE